SVSPPPGAGTFCGNLFSHICLLSQCYFQFGFFGNFGYFWQFSPCLCASVVGFVFPITAISLRSRAISVILTLLLSLYDFPPPWRHAVEIFFPTFTRLPITRSPDHRITPMLLLSLYDFPPPWRHPMEILFSYMYLPPQRPRLSPSVRR